MKFLKVLLYQLFIFIVFYFHNLLYLFASGGFTKQYLTDNSVMFASLVALSTSYCYAKIRELKKDKENE